MGSLFLNNLEQHIDLMHSLRDINPDVLVAFEECSEVVANGGTIFFCGNGGSAGDAQHFAAELVGRLYSDRPSISGVALTVDSSALTCIGNDFGFEEIFSRQLEGVGRKGDCVVLISTSGESENLIKAAKVSKAMNIRVVGLLGKGGGALKEMCDNAIVVPHTDTARIQEAHGLIGHSLCQYIEQSLSASKPQ